MHHREPRSKAFAAYEKPSHTSKKALLAAVSKVLDNYWQAELADWQSTDPRPGQGEHIKDWLRILKNWMEEQRPSEVRDYTERKLP